MLKQPRLERQCPDVPSTIDAILAEHKCLSMNVGVLVFTYSECFPCSDSRLWRPKVVRTLGVYKLSLVVPQSRVCRD